MTKDEAIKLIENMHDVFPSRQEEILDILDQLDLRTEKDKLNDLYEKFGKLEYKSQTQGLTKVEGETKYKLLKQIGEME